MKGIIFDFKALKEYSERIAICNGYVQDGNYRSALEGYSFIRILLERENRLENDAKKVIREKIRLLESQAHGLQGRIDLKIFEKNHPTPPYDGAS